MISAVAARYARAFADVVLSKSDAVSPADAVKQLRALEELMSQSSDLRHALASPAVRASQKRAVIGKFAGELNVGPLTRNFLFVLIDHQRIEMLSQIREAVEAEFDHRLGFVRAGISSAMELEGPRAAAIEAGLVKMTGKQVRARFQVDPSLIGGVVARIGSTVYDGSIRGQLETLRRQIAHHTAAGI
jgi:F-type H+-transporting ATPase subunit delta